MIDSRDYVAVSNWLKTYKNLNIVSRDGSIIYSSAITEAHPEVVQISDNGLTEGSVNKIKVIKRIMYGRCDFKTLRQKVLKLEELRLIN